MAVAVVAVAVAPAAEVCIGAALGQKYWDPLSQQAFSPTLAAACPFGHFMVSICMWRHLDNESESSETGCLEVV